MEVIHCLLLVSGVVGREPRALQMLYHKSCTKPCILTLFTFFPMLGFEAKAL